MEAKATRFPSPLTDGYPDPPSAGVLSDAIETRMVRPWTVSRRKTCKAATSHPKPKAVIISSVQ